MKSLLWIIASVSVGVLTYIVLNQQAPQYATGSADIEDAAGKTTLWGSKQRLAGTGGSLVGNLKEGVGNATGNEELAGEGVSDQVVGTVKDTVGKVANAAGETIHDLNR